MGRGAVARGVVNDNDLLAIPDVKATPAVIAQGGEEVLATSAEPLQHR
jgi:hypothetical protein